LSGIEGARKGVRQSACLSCSTKAENKRDLTMNSGDPLVAAICGRYGNDQYRLMDILADVQCARRCIDGAALDALAAALRISRVQVEGAATFYGFLSAKPAGACVIRLCDDVIDEMKGAEAVAAALASELQIGFGETTPDGRFSLARTACIGMSDQAPAALVDDLVVTQLRPGAAREMIRALAARGEGTDVRTLLNRPYGDGNNAHDLVRSMVVNNLRLSGQVLFAEMERGAALRKALAINPAEVIREVKTSRLRGRGGAGFPTGMKWEYTRASKGSQRFLIANADEGEPGTFKDRVLLTERPDLLFEGMTVGGYAIGADSGILYLRGEYAYLREFLESVLTARRGAGLLGRDILGKKGFHFDVRIQMGAGAYVCGEETALINSCEGKRGDPRTRPPFPVQEGYLGKPTCVNNVETLCCAARVLDMGSGWFSAIGTSGSTGTKLLSVAGDCSRPGVFELPLGTTLRAALKLAGAESPIAVQVGGPSGQMVGPADFDRGLSFDDLSTGGAVTAFGPGRDVLAIASKYMEFFVHESCGFCVPCRVGNVLLKERLDRIRDGRGRPSDLDYLKELGETVTIASRCGLGQSSPRPVLTTLQKFRPEYERRCDPSRDGDDVGFDLEAALAGARR
jgi:[NiFe] hydrogenase diaphorase moiety large subunit